MSLKPPAPVGGTGKDAQWFNQLLNYCKSLELKSVFNGRVNRGPQGTLIEANGASAPSTGATLDVFYYQLSMGDYIWCTNVKLPAAGGVTVTYTPIAKTPKLRNSIAFENIDGTVVNYSYTAYTTAGLQYLRRDASIAGNSVTEKQDVNPRFIANDTIHAMKVTGGTGLNTIATDPKNTTPNIPQSIDYIDMNLDARAWTQRDDQST